MHSPPPDSNSSFAPTQRPLRRKSRRRRRLVLVGLTLLAFLLVVRSPVTEVKRLIQDPRYPGQWDYTAPLVMEGGDPYVRALMRTISASEANDLEPYSLLYGGYRLQDLRQHPDECITIVAGPNEGDCTTAAGRYQFITTTWEDVAALYHPQQNPLRFWSADLSFEPEYQDLVVYRWLSDPGAWGIDIPELLRQGRLDEVLQNLSSTWTSLGYGIETNSMTGYLPTIYERALREELQRVGQSVELDSDNAS